jgi:DNA-binding response OmpR family regulator
MIEDERGLVLSVGDRLRAEGYTFEWASDGLSGQAKAQTGSFDLALIDLMLPGRNGFDIVRSLREAAIRMPLLLVTARDQIIDRVSGLRAGADDYIVKPFSMDELVARIEAHLRRARPDAVVVRPFRLDHDRADLAFGPYRISYQKAGLFRGDERIALTFQEFKLLCILADHPGQVLDTATLLEWAWGYGEEVTSRTLYVHISWLRKKLQPPAGAGDYIRTVRRLGYFFQP